MEHLPSLAVCEIARYLTTKDLRACCATSVGWRETFNQDMVWSRRCDRAIAAHLKVTPCQVKPRFESPESPHSSLSAICPWRLSYMREVHLWNNWREGRIVYNTIPSINRDLAFVQFINNDQVLLQLWHDKNLMLIDVSGTLVHIYNPITLPNGDKILLCEIIDDLILFMTYKDALIYQMTSSFNEEWKLQTVLELPFHSEDVLGIPFLHSDMAFFTGGTLVVGSYSPSVGFIDIKSHEKVIVKLPEPMPCHRSLLRGVVDGGKHSQMFAILLEYISTQEVPPESSILTVHIYSLEKRAFLNFQLSMLCDYNTRNYIALIHDNHFAIFRNFASLRIYNILNSELIVEVPCLPDIHETAMFCPEFVKTTSHRIIKVIKEGGDPKSILCFERHRYCSLTCFSDNSRWDNAMLLFQNVNIHLKLSIINHARYNKNHMNRAYTKLLNINCCYILTFW